MKKKAPIIFLIASIVILGFLYSLFLLEGKSCLVNKLKSLVKKDVSIGSLSYIPPFQFEIKRLDIPGALKADKILITPSVLSLFTGKLELNEIKVVNPEITYEKLAKIKTSPVTNSSIPAQTTSVQSAGADKNDDLRFVFKRINISQGKINIYDRTAGTSGIKITIKDITLNLTNARNMSSVISNFDIKGNIPWEEGKEEGVFTAHGWIDLFKKDINALLKIEGIDGIYLYPYYADWINIQKTNIESAKLNFLSNIHGHDNNVSAECHLELSDIVFKQNPADEQQKKTEKIVHSVLDKFKALEEQGKVVVNFTFKTKMDSPEFGFQIIKGALEDKIANSKKSGRPFAEDIVLFPAIVVGGALKGATEISKAVIDGSFAVGNEFKKALQASFRTGK